jgi:ubiquinone/menaquinone biosynthesis C-methylase UbiE
MNRGPDEASAGEVDRADAGSREDTGLSAGATPGPAAAAVQTVWSRYWATGVLHSCPTSFTGNYEGEVADFWARSFSGLGPGQRVLDLGCGNGPLAELLWRSTAARGCHYDGVDLAQVNPVWLATLADADQSQFSFHGGVAAEELPFADASFDLVVSQFGLEYTALERTVREVARVLKGTGRVALVVHHAASRTLELARDEVTHLQWLLEPEGLMEQTRQLVPFVARSATAEGRRSLATDAAANALRARFNAVQQELSARASRASCPDPLHETRQAIAVLLEATARGGESEGLRRHEGLTAALEDGLQRLTALCRCALDEAGIGRLAGQLGRGRPAQVCALQAQGHLMAWGVALNP